MSDRSGQSPSSDAPGDSREWTEYRAKGQHVTEPMVTLDRSGTFTLNRAARDLLRDPAAVRLLFDDRDRVVGFQASRVDDPDAFRLRNRERPSALVTGAAFCRHFGIPYDERRRYAAHLTFNAHLEDEVLCVSLDAKRFRDV